MASRGIEIKSPYLVVSDGSKIVYAYPDTVCLAILEYYAFEAGQHCRERARKNFRILAGKALQEFIYTQVGYDPKQNVPDIWRQFHDRISLTYDATPTGYFGVFKEIADIVVTLGQAGLHIDSNFVPDISVGRAWSKHWCDNELHKRYGDRKRYDHRYPDYFPQSDSNPQEAFCYPEAALGEFRHWIREKYIGGGKFEAYLDGNVKRNELPASFAKLAISVYNAGDD